MLRHLSKPSLRASFASPGHQGIIRWEMRCRVCPYAIRVMGYIVRKLNAVPSTAAWLAVRLSYGMNGIIMPTRNLPSLTGYLKWVSGIAIAQHCASSFPVASVLHC